MTAKALARWMPAIAAFCTSTSIAAAQAPTISSIQPQAAAAGETTELVISGAGLAGATEVWTGFPCRVELPSADAGSKEGGKDGRLVCRMTVPGGARRWTSASDSRPPATMDAKRSTWQMW